VTLGLVGTICRVIGRQSLQNHDPKTTRIARRKTLWGIHRATKRWKCILLKLAMLNGLVVCWLFGHAADGTTRCWCI